MGAADFDTDLGALIAAANQVQLYLNPRPVPQVIIYSTDPATIQAITNLQPHAGQSFSRARLVHLADTNIFSFSEPLKSNSSVH